MTHHKLQALQSLSKCQPSWCVSGRKPAIARRRCRAWTGEAIYQATDFEFLRDRCNAQGAGCPDPLVAGDVYIRVTAMHLSPTNVCVPLISPALLDHVFHLVHRPWNFKISTDGTYRLLFEGYAVLTVGINVKHWCLRRDDSLKVWSFCSSFVPLCFAFCNKENEHGYAHMFAAMVAAAQQLGHEIRSEHILQWHGDLHRGIEAARESLAPTATRVSDWAHVLGVTTQGRTGIIGILQHSLTGASKQDFIAWVLQWCRISRQWPLRLFHVIWCQIFSVLEANGQQSAAEKLKCNHFYQIVLEGEEMWEAAWRCAPDRVMPGTAAGSAPQESWHGKTLKPHFGVTPRSPFEIAHVLQEKVVKAQVRQLQALKQQGKKLEDWPGVGGFLDQHILSNDAELKKEGRTSSQQLLNWSKHQRYVDESENVWLLVPTSKLKVDWTRSHGYAENKTSRKYKVRELDNLPPHATKHFAKIVTSTTVSQVTESLASLNIYDPSTGITSWKAAAKLFDDWRLVVSGPHTADLWALHNVEELGSNQHSMWLCYGCPIASKWGPCEHMYCALEHEGCINAVDLPKPKPKGRPKTSALKPTAKVPGALLVPGCGLASNSGAASSTSAPPNVHQMSEADVALQNCLRAAGLGQYFRHMQQECVTLGALQDFTFQDYKVFFGMTIGEAHKLMQQLQPRARASVLCADRLPDKDLCNVVDVCVCVGYSPELWSEATYVSGCFCLLQASTASSGPSGSCHKTGQKRDRDALNVQSPGIKRYWSLLASLRCVYTFDMSQWHRCALQCIYPQCIYPLFHGLGWKPSSGGGLRHLFCPVFVFEEVGILSMALTLQSLAAHDFKFPLKRKWYSARTSPVRVLVWVYLCQLIASGCRCWQWCQCRAGSRWRCWNCPGPGPYI